MKKICFYNHLHNGDVFNSKKFVDQISRSIDTEIYYAHLKHQKILSDLEFVKYKKLDDLPKGEKFFEDDEYFYINTWIAPYFEPGVQYFGECTLRFLYVMYEKIFDKLNQKFGCNITLNSIETYFPDVDYKKYKINSVEKYKGQHNILISNGPCLSGQSQYTGDMEEIIKELAVSNPDKNIFITHVINTDLKNVIFTGELFEDCDGCDLNEISYLSTICSLIVGRNSGPFCFTNTYQNLMSSDKTFFAFGSRETDCFPYGIDIECNFVFEYYQNNIQILETIKGLIK